MKSQASTLERIKVPAFTQTGVAPAKVVSGVPTTTTDRLNRTPLPKGGDLKKDFDAGASQVTTAKGGKETQTKRKSVARNVS